MLRKHAPSYLFLCNGECECKNSTGCGVNGNGDCIYTTDIRYAKNFNVSDFILVCNDDYDIPLIFAEKQDPEA